ncbi:MAG: 2-C-methyl-D-erythritol 4-phosphate cytidylyltransferase [Pseudomonadota bacterium]
MATVKFWAVIPAAGSGTRLGSDVPKAWFKIEGRTLLEWTLDLFLQSDWIEFVIITTPLNASLPLTLQNHPKIKAIHGGAERCLSVLKALESLDADENDWVLVHDAARPFLSKNDLENLKSQLENNLVGGLLAVPLRDTLKKHDFNTNQIETVPRKDFWQALTPQMFRYGILKNALDAVINTQQLVTDEAEAVEKAGFSPKLVEGNSANIKITYPADIAFARSQLTTLFKKSSSWPRTGWGYDVHAFGEGNGLMIGGVWIPYEKGIIAHSDGDVILHALCDALLGAAGLGDIGVHFPPTDNHFAGVASRFFLEKVLNLILEKGFIPFQMDLTLIAERPKITPHREKIIQTISEICQLNPQQINLKATTTEGLGFEGRQEGIAAAATVLIIPNK